MSMKKTANLHEMVGTTNHQKITTDFYQKHITKFQTLTSHDSEIGIAYGTKSQILILTSLIHRQTSIDKIY